MNTIGYFRGAPGYDGRALIREYAKRRGASVPLILSDGRGEYSGLRSLQSLVKLHECRRVIVPELSALGEDEYLVREMLMFFRRNGVKLVCLSLSGPDRRHDIAECADRFFSRITDRDERYGRMLPLVSTRDGFKRKPPFGYRVEDGDPVIDPEEAELVRLIFSRYIEDERICSIAEEVNSLLHSKRFGNMTVKTILRNERYLGRQSKKGYHLPAIITYDVWLRARERLERDYPPVRDPEPYIDVVSTEGVFFIRGSDPDSPYRMKCAGGRLTVDSDALERSVEKLISACCTAANADSFYDGYVLPEMLRAAAAKAEAYAELSQTQSEFNRMLSEVCRGARDDAAQMALESLTDRKNICAMRSRRIDSEAELFSIERERVAEFFNRAARIYELSIEERRFISEAFVPCVRISRDGVKAELTSPVTGRTVPVRLDGVVLN